MIAYKKGYKYQVYRTVEVETGVIPLKPVGGDYSELSMDGILTIKKGFSYDGPSGPTIDSKNFMAAALAHDALYELMRLGMLPRGHGYRKQADKLLRDMCRQNGMTKVRSWWVYRGVRLGAGPSAKPVNQRKVHTAPAHGWREVQEET